MEYNEREKAIDALLTKIDEPGHAKTNLDFFRTLPVEEIARIFVKLRYDSAEESDWISWLNMPCKKEEWKRVLT